MFCPRCLEKVNAFSTKCRSCTADYGIIELWLVNLLAWVFAVSMVLGLLWAIF